MGWNDVLKDGQGGGGDNKRLTLTPNTTTKVHILLNEGEEPYSYWTHYLPHVGPKGRVVICPGRDICPVCQEGGHQTRRRHALNVWDYDTSSVKILDAGNTIMQQLKEIYDHYGSLDKVDVAIKRTGEGRDTKYTTIPLPLTTAFDWGIVEGKLHSLPAEKSAHTPDTINKWLAGDTGASNAPKEPTQQKPQSTPPPKQSFDKQVDEAVDTSDPMLEFGKYKGWTLSQIADQDIAYVKWMKENIKDDRIRKLAEKAYEKCNSGMKHHLEEEQQQKEEAPAQGDDRQIKLQSVQTLIQDLPPEKLAGVMQTMRKITTSKQNPAGKSLLGDLDLDELAALDKAIVDGDF